MICIISYVNKEAKEAVADFRERIKQYEKSYEALDNSDCELSNISFILNF
jgi:hypothetical protein